MSQKGSLTDVIFLGGIMPFAVDSKVTHCQCHDDGNND